MTTYIFKIKEENVHVDIYKYEKNSVKEMVAKEIQNICFELFYFWYHMFLMAINFN